MIWTFMKKIFLPSKGEMCVSLRRGWGFHDWEHCPFKRVEGLCVIECIHPLDFVAVMHSLSCMHH